VLPFATVDDDPSLEYLARGVPMELTTSLAQIGAIRVIPWSFMKRVDGTMTQREVAERTQADAILEGTIQWVPDTQKGSVRVNVQMFHANNGLLLWTQSFERSVGSMLAFQAELAREIAGRFQVLLARREQALLDRYASVPPDALELYLKGRAAWEAYADNFVPAVNYLQQAIAAHPQFADAYATLAECYTLQAGFAANISSSAAYERAMEAANRAISLDPELPDGWASRGYAQALLGWNWRAADADFQRALTLGPNSPAVRGAYSNYLSMVGRHDEAITQARLAEERAPQSPSIGRRVAWALYMRRHYDEAISQLEHVLATEPGYAPARSLLARAYAMAGRYDEAITQIEPVQKGFEAISAQVYAQAGRRDEALRLLASATRPGQASGNPPYQVAAAYASLHDQQAAIRWMTRAFEVRDPSLVNIAFDPRLDASRDNPEFNALVQRMKIVQP
jgi:TolB-like protein/Tfp pilus assembly protein PilF